MTGIRSSLLFLAVFLLSFPAQSFANEPKPDDRVIFDVSAEDWVNTKTARVTVSVEASVGGNTAGTMRAAMAKAVNDLVKADWRLVSFNRDQDPSAMERWSAEYEARVQETDLSGLYENAKKLSKAGMQLSVSSIDFSPTLDEMQSAYGQLRAKIYKMAGEQLAALNASLPGRPYRIALINFTGDNEVVMPRPMPQVMRGMPEGGISLKGNNVASSVAAMPTMERSEKITLTARVVFAVNPPAGTSAPVVLPTANK